MVDLFKIWFVATFPFCVHLCSFRIIHATGILLFSAKQKCSKLKNRRTFKSNTPWVCALANEMLVRVCTLEFFRWNCWLSPLNRNRGKSVVLEWKKPPTKMTHLCFNGQWLLLLNSKNLSWHNSCSVLARRICAFSLNTAIFQASMVPVALFVITHFPIEYQYLCSTFL